MFFFKPFLAIISKIDEPKPPTEECSSIVVIFLNFLINVRIFLLNGFIVCIKYLKHLGLVLKQSQ